MDVDIAVLWEVGTLQSNGGCTLLSLGGDGDIALPRGGAHCGTVVGASFVEVALQPFVGRGRGRDIAVPLVGRGGFPLGSPTHASCHREQNKCDIAILWAAQAGGTFMSFAGVTVQPRWRDTVVPWGRGGLRSCGSVQPNPLGRERLGRDIAVQWGGEEKGDPEGGGEGLYGPQELDISGPKRSERTLLQALGSTRF